MNITLITVLKRYSKSRYLVLWAGIICACVTFALYGREGGNVASAQAPQADFVLNKFQSPGTVQWATSNSGTAAVGQQLIFQYQVSNVGTLSDGYIANRLYVNGNAITPDEFHASSILFTPPNNVWPATPGTNCTNGQNDGAICWTPASAGTYSIQMKTDAGTLTTLDCSLANTGNRPELNEGNNCLAVAYTLTVGNPAPQPNLTSSLYPITTPPVVGAVTSFGGRVRNDGTANAGISRARFCLDGTAAACADGTGSALGTLKSVAAIAPNTSLSVTSDTWTAIAGTHTVHLCADGLGVIAESLETDNCSLTTFTVGIIPPSDTTPPQITSFSLRSRTTTDPAVFDWAATDETQLMIAELWCAPAASFCTDTDKTGCAWGTSPKASQLISGTQALGQLTYTPPDGTHYCGIHVRDTSGNEALEPTPPGPLKLEKTSLPPPSTFTLTVVKTGNGFVTGGGINCGGACQVNANSGANITLSASPDPGYSFSSWSGCDTASGAQCNVSMLSNKTVTATFSQNQPALPTVTIIASDANAAESGTPATNPGSFTVSRTGATTNPLSVMLSTSGSTAAVTADYTHTLTTTPNGLQAIISAGQTFVDVAITPADDAATESSETVILTIGSSSAYTVAPSPGNQATVTIADNDGPINQVPNQPINQSPANSATVTTLTPTLQASAFSDPDAGDTQAASQWQLCTTTTCSTTSWDSGTLSARTSTGLPGSLTDGTTYWWRVRYQDQSGLWSAYSNITSFTVNATSGLPTVTITSSDTDASESGTPANNPGAFTISRTGSTTNALTVMVTTSGSTASVGGDYVHTLSSTPNGLLATIPAGASMVAIPITPVDDSVVESAETVIFTISPSGAYILGSPGSATVSIADNDSTPALPSINIVASDPSAAENSTAPDTGTFTVTRAGDSSLPLSINFSTSGGTASVGSDYTHTLSSTPNGLQLIVPAGASTHTVVITPVDDTTAESNETVLFTITPSGSYTLGPLSSATITIADNDSAPPPAQAGDLSCDGTVGPRDLGILFSFWGRPVASSISNASSSCQTPLSSLGAADTIVNSNDLSILLANWGRTVAPGPVQCPTGAVNAAVSQTQYFKAQATDPQNDTPLTYTFTWGDASAPQAVTSALGTAAVASHAWSGTGSFQVRATAADPSSNVSPQSNTVTVCVR